VRLRAEPGRPLRIGHRGAMALAAENTLTSLEYALAAAVDLVEFDVIRLEGELVLAHSPAERAPCAPGLAEALRFLSDRADASVGFMVDLKAPGYEREVVEALRRAGVLDRSLVSSAYGASVRAVRAAEPRLATGLAYPRDRYGLNRRLPQGTIVTGLEVLRRLLPLRIEWMLRRARADVAVLNWLLVTPGLVTRCHRAGRAVFAWTVERPDVVAALLDAGVDGLVVNDPGILDDPGPFHS